MSLYLVSAVLILCQCCQCANILVVMTVSSKSHHILIQPLLTQLVSRGHNLTFITDSKSLKQPMDNFTEIVIVPKYQLEVPKFMNILFQSRSSKQIFSMLELSFNVGQLMCKNTLGDDQVQKLLYSDQKFDLVIAEIFISQECFVGLGHRFQAPVVGLTTFPGQPYLDAYLVNPNSPAVVPNWLSSFSDNMSFFQRGWNALLTAAQLYQCYMYNLPVQEEIMRNYIPNRGKWPTITDLLSNVSLALQNSQVGSNIPRANIPSIIEVGGMHIPEQRNPLPKDLQLFMDTATEGVVYFSLGSAIPPDQMPDRLKQVFLKAFGELKQKVLWKVNGDSFPEQPSNVMLVKWLPQYDVLAHKNCKVFITHGGMLSIQEAIYFGVPLIGFPFFGDQGMNLAFVESRGIGITIDVEQITYETFSRALSEILDNPTYAANMKQQSAVFRDSQLTPLQKALYWTEYVIRHQGGAHLQSAALQLSWFQYHLLDVVLALVAVTVISVSIFIYIIKTIFKKLFPKKQHKD